MRPTDQMPLDSIHAQQELLRLRTLIAGDVVNEAFLPALGQDMHWVCLRADGKVWAFEARYQGQHVLTIDIEEVGDQLVASKRGAL